MQVHLNIVQCMFIPVFDLLLKRLNIQFFYIEIYVQTTFEEKVKLLVFGMTLKI